MTQDELIYMNAIWETGSIAKAAEQLYISRSAVSYCLQKVENEIGTTLFKRTTGGMQITPAGEIYIRYAKGILNQYKQMQNEIQDISDLKAGYVTFGAPFSVTAAIIPKVLLRMKELYPGIQCNALDLSAPKMEEKLLRGQIDFLISHLPLDIEGIAVRPIMEERFFVVFSSRHFLKRPFLEEDSAGDIYVDLQKIENIPCFLTPASYRDRKLVEELLHKNGKNLENVQEYYSYHSIFGMVRSGFGYTIAPCCFCIPYWHDSCLDFYPLPSDVGTCGKIALCYLENNPLPATVKIVMEVCCQVFTELYSSKNFDI